MKKLPFKIFSIVAIIVIAAGGLFLAPPITAFAGEKVYVCKYVGTPGVNERLQTGQNPIEVSINAVGGASVGSYFNDQQGRSYVLGTSPTDPEPTAVDCPGGTQTCEEDPTQQKCQCGEVGQPACEVTCEEDPTQQKCQQEEPSCEPGTGAVTDPACKPSGHPNRLRCGFIQERWENAIYGHDKWDQMRSNACWNKTNDDAGRWLKHDVEK